MSKYEIRARRLATLFKALAHPVRLRIFEAIRAHCCVAEGQSGELCGFHVGDLYTLVAVAPSTVSHHLAELKSAGLVVERRSGTFLYLTLGPEAVADLVAFAHGDWPSSCGDSGARPAPTDSCPPIPIRKTAR